MPIYHNSGIGSHTSQAVNILPYSVFDYIRDFNGNQILMYYIEQKWKDNTRCLRSQGINDPRIWLQKVENELIDIYL